MPACASTAGTTTLYSRNDAGTISNFPTVFQGASHSFIDCSSKGATAASYCITIDDDGSAKLYSDISGGGTFYNSGTVIPGTYSGGALITYWMMLGNMTNIVEYAMLDADGNLSLQTNSPKIDTPSFMTQHKYIDVESDGSGFAASNTSNLLAIDTDGVPRWFQSDPKNNWTDRTDERNFSQVTSGTKWARGDIAFSHYTTSSSKVAFSGAMWLIDDKGQVSVFTYTVDDGWKKAETPSILNGKTISQVSAISWEWMSNQRFVSAAMLLESDGKLVTATLPEEAFTRLSNADSTYPNSTICTESHDDATTTECNMYQGTYRDIAYVSTGDGTSGNGPNSWNYQYLMNGTPAPLIASKHTLTFDLNGAPGTAPTTQTVNDGALPTKPTDPTWDGHTFKGWYTAADGGAEFDFTQSLANDATVYAQWETTGTTIACAPQTGDPAASIWQWSSLIIGALTVGLGVYVNVLRRRAKGRLNL